MSDNYVQSAVGSVGGTTSAATLAGVTAGSVLVAFAWDGGGGSFTSVTDAQGSYTGQGSVVGPDGNSVSAKIFVLHNANAGSHTATLTTTVAAFLVLVEITGATSGSVSDAKGATQAAPAGTDVTSSGSLTVSAAATLIAMATDTQQATPGVEPAAGTAFSDRAHAVNGNVGSWRLESKAVSANAAATFTSQEATPHITIAAAILNSGGGPTPGLLNRNLWWDNL